MADGTPTAYDNGSGLAYPLTKMNFLVQLSSDEADAAFSEVTGIDASADVIEFRQGNSQFLSPVKLSGLVKHGNITLKYGFTSNVKFKQWIERCIADDRKTALPRQDITIELIDTNNGIAATKYDKTTGNTQNTWILKNAWACKYSGPDLNALQSEVAIESVEIAYERLEMMKTGS